MPASISGNEGIDKVKVPATFSHGSTQTTAYRPEGYIYIRDQKASGAAAQTGSGATWGVSVTVSDGSSWTII